MADSDHRPRRNPHLRNRRPSRPTAPCEQGLGVGARELTAQRDPGGVVTRRTSIRTRWTQSVDDSSDFEGDEDRPQAGRSVPPLEVRPISASGPWRTSPGTIVPCWRRPDAHSVTVRSGGSS